MSWLKDPIGLTPLDFFALSWDCPFLNFEDFGRKKSRLKKPWLLPTTELLTGESHFAEVAMGWNDSAILVWAEVNGKNPAPAYPDVVAGSCVELFFDTRDVKTSGYNTRFCHRFFFLPEAVDGVQAGELTHFRNVEESHPLCSSSLLQVESKVTSKGYSMEIIIPSSCLYGFDPRQFDRLGFTYRINRSNLPPQHFSASTVDYQIEQQPSLWSSLRLIK